MPQTSELIKLLKVNDIKHEFIYANGKYHLQFSSKLYRFRVPIEDNLWNQPPYEVKVEQTFRALMTEAQSYDCAPKWGQWCVLMGCEENTQSAIAWQKASRSFFALNRLLLSDYDIFARACI